MKRTAINIMGEGVLFLAAKEELVRAVHLAIHGAHPEMTADEMEGVLSTDRQITFHEMELSQDDIATMLGKLYSRRLNGTVRCWFDEEDGVYTIKGDRLPPHPDLADVFPNGWSLLDSIQPGDVPGLIREWMTTA